VIDRCNIRREISIDTEGYLKLDTTTPHESVPSIIESEKQRVFVQEFKPQIFTQEGPCKKFVKSNRDIASKE